MATSFFSQELLNNVEKSINRILFNKLTIILNFIPIIIFLQNYAPQR